MYLTKEILIQHGACDEGAQWFERWFPEGAELIDVIEHKYVTTEFLHWGFSHLSTSLKEQAAYHAKLGNDEQSRQTLYHSDHIVQSRYVTNSSDVYASDHIFTSSKVSFSDNVINSKLVENSNRVYLSSYVTSSSKILGSSNVTDSRNIVNSKFVVSSTNIFHGDVITNSHFINSFSFGRTTNITDSAFISDCKNLNKCLFCTNISDVEYHIFNKPINERHFDIIVKQMHTILGDTEAMLTLEWPSYTIPIDTPRINRNIIKQYSTLPKEFWEWVKTLPNYDSGLLYTITLNPELF